MTLINIGRKLGALQAQSRGPLEFLTYASRGVWITFRALLKLDTQCKFGNGSVPVVFPPKRVGIVRMAYTFRDRYEPELKFLPRLVTPSMTVVDVGANYGVYTVPLSRLVGDSGRVLAFEPDSETRRYLARTVSRLNNVIIAPCALSNVEGRGTMTTHSFDPGSNSVDINMTGDVVVTTLDAWLERHRIGKVDYIKLDIEGAEYLALLGASRTLDGRPVVQFEWNPKALKRHTGETALGLLSARGYNFYRLKDNSLRLITEPPAELCNLIALPSEFNLGGSQYRHG
jgi:FkbM family methyltransferase